ncbi:MAG: hypothetical protein KY428_04360, partial [Bacteroidetes bacterium]|nr:hypothetical protein [Bacteroidota bacterium]
MNLADKFKKFSAGKLTENSPVNSTTGNNVLLIDGTNSYMRTFAATPTMNEDGEHMGGVTGFLMSLGYTIRTFKPSRVIIVFDGKNGSQRRRQLFKDYKGGRRYMTKLNRTYDWSTVEDEVKSRNFQLEMLISLLNYLPVTIILENNVEADDVIAYAAQTLETRGNNVTIMSSDKDFLQLVNKNIRVWNPIKKKMYNPETVQEDYGFHPNNFLLYRTVTGDSSDCIPGVEKIKEKTLLKFFPELAEEDPKDVDFLFETARKHVEASKKPPVALQNLLRATDQLKLNHALMRLDDVAMSEYTRGSVLNRLDSPPNEYNKMELTRSLRLYKLIHAFPNYESWLLTIFVPLMRYKL